MVRGYIRVQVFGPRAPKGSSFWALVARGFVFLVFERQKGGVDSRASLPPIPPGSREACALDQQGPNHPHVPAQELSCLTTYTRCSLCCLQHYDLDNSLGICNQRVSLALAREFEVKADCFDFGVSNGNATEVLSCLIVLLRGRLRVRVFRPRAPKGSSFLALGAKRFEFFGTGRQTVRVFGL